MAGKKKVAEMIKLVSMAGTGYFYTTKKNPKLPYKLMLRKYDPRINQHVLFKVRDSIEPSY
jgi:large subunit ribosomal protein L33